MRSRYSAFVEHDAAHLLRTWHPATRPASLDFDPELRWIGLEIVAGGAGGIDDTDG
ncbi:MAG: motif domain protein, partial [Nocardioidaceae bacterium]|nr:motif domain protein [Nocardioidaceae bacterium]